jgi:nanoRNase/pAp phosphatase (c-di-AMP/oligoRNAs hydrolase)
VLYPQCNVSLRIQWGPGRETVVVSAGHSTINRTCTTNIGVLMSGYGGGGHVGAGSAPLPPQRADELIGAILDELDTTTAS